MLPVPDVLNDGNAHSMMYAKVRSTEETHITRFRNLDNIREILHLGERIM
jgi:hypothetical protein